MQCRRAGIRQESLIIARKQDSIRVPRSLSTQPRMRTLNYNPPLISNTDT